MWDDDTEDVPVPQALLTNHLLRLLVHVCSGWKEKEGRANEALLLDMGEFMLRSATGDLPEILPPRDFCGDITPSQGSWAGTSNHRVAPEPPDGPAPAPAKEWTSDDDKKTTQGLEHVAEGGADGGKGGVTTQSAQLGLSDGIDDGDTAVVAALEHSAHSVAALPPSRIFHRSGGSFLDSRGGRGKPLAPRGLRRFKIFQVLSPNMASRGRIFGSQLALKDEWAAIDASYFEAMGENLPRLWKCGQLSTSGLGCLIVRQLSHFHCCLSFRLPQAATMNFPMNFPMMTETCMVLPPLSLF